MRRWPLALVVVLAAAGAGCSGSSKAATPSASVTSPPTTAATTTTSLTVEQQVEAAYLHSWDVYAKAAETLDASHLSEVFAPPQLDAMTRDIADRVSRHRPQHVAADHHLAFRLVDPGTGVIRDTYVNHTIEFDSTTGQPTEADPNENLSDTATLKLIEGAWKVTAIVRQRS